MRILVIGAAAMVAASGCGSDCKLPSLEQACATGFDCRPYDTRVAEITGSPCMSGASVSPFIEVQLLRCGDVRQIADSGLAGAVYTYSPAGTVVGVTGFGDTPDDEGCYERSAGHTPDCDTIDARYLVGFVGGDRRNRCYLPAQ